MKVNVSLMNRNNTGWLKSHEWRQRPKKWKEYARFRSMSVRSTKDRSTSDSSRKSLLNN